MISGVSLLSIRIGPIEKDLVKTILSETLLLPPTLCQTLSTTIHSKTGGVVLFVMNFFKSLNEEGLLWFNLSSRRWYVTALFGCNHQLLHYIPHCSTLCKGILTLAESSSKRYQQMYVSFAFCNDHFPG